MISLLLTSQNMSWHDSAAHNATWPSPTANNLQHNTKAISTYPSVLSQAPVMLLAVSLTMFCGILPKCLSVDFQSVIYFLPLGWEKHGFSTLTYNLEHGNYSDVYLVFLYLPQLSLWNCAPDLTENASSQLLCSEFTYDEESPLTMAGFSFI